MDRESFLREYNIDEATFESARISWEELEKIYRNYQTIEPKLRSIGKEFVDRYFYDVEKAGIHSYRYRAKDQGHLLEKIIRKRNENFEKYENINSENFYKFITDLIGIRVFFLYREDYYADKSTVDPTVPSIMEVDLAKNRHGRVGRCEMAFSMASSRITAVARNRKAGDLPEQMRLI